MSKKRKTVNSQLVKYPVLIVKPHNKEYQTDERVNHFIMKAFGRGIAEYEAWPSKLPELVRNRAITEFLHSPTFKKKTHLFFLDSDTCPVNDFAIERLLSFGKDVIAGITPIVRVDNDIQCMWSAQKDDEYYGWDDLPKTLFKADRIGGTTLLLSRKVLEKLEPPYQITEYNDNMTNVKLSEDYYFSDKIKKAGFDIWVDPDTVCHHYHMFNLLEIYNIWKQCQKKIYTK